MWEIRKNDEEITRDTTYVLMWIEIIDKIQIQIQS